MSHITGDRIRGLPAPVRRSLLRSGVVGRQVPARPDLRQRGQMLLRGRWLPFTAAESYTLDPPGFTWNGTVRMAGIPRTRARDSLTGGRGGMRVRLLGLFTVVDESGPAMDQGALMRWLNETMWFPQVWVTDLITWEPGHDTSALGTVTAGDTAAAAEFRFDPEGRLIDFRGDRYRVTDSGSGLVPWSTPLSAHGRFDGIEVPTRGHAVWELPDGDEQDLRLEVTGLRFE